MQETWVQSLHQEDLLEKEMATHSSILARRISWTEEPVGLWSIGSQRVGHDWSNLARTQTYSPWGHKELDTIARLSLSLLEIAVGYIYIFQYIYWIYNIYKYIYIFQMFRYFYIYTYINLSSSYLFKLPSKMCAPIYISTVV